MTATVIVEHLTRRYLRGAEHVTALDDVSIEINEGELTVVAGPSGSGKTTLLSVLAGHEAPDAGTVTMPPRSWSNVALVPQSLALIEELSIRENVEFPALLAPEAGAREGYSVEELLRMFEIDHLADRKPEQTSGGEQQRAALCRAMRLSPTLLLADEPTGHQDPARVLLVLDTLRRHARAGNAVLISSHDEQVIAAADRVLWLADGRLAGNAVPQAHA